MKHAPHAHPNRTREKPHGSAAGQCVGCVLLYLPRCEASWLLVQQNCWGLRIFRPPMLILIGSLPTVAVGLVGPFSDGCFDGGSDAGIQVVGFVGR